MKARGDTSVQDAAGNCGTRGSCDVERSEQLTATSRLTVVVSISSYVLYYQGPLPLRVLIPRVSGHEGPVIKSL